jgi:hypothetical protein
VTFPFECPKDWSEEGTQMHFNWPTRKKARKENSLDVSGADQTVTSRHYDEILIDDAVVKENVPPWATEETMRKVIDWFHTLNAILKVTDRTAYKTIVGTRWNDGDLYGDLIRSDLARYYKTLVLTPYTDDTQTVSIWPSKFPLEVLDEMRAEYKEYAWACLMMQNPLPPESAVRFLAEWFKPFSEDLPYGSKAITVDPAFSEKSAHADRSAIACTVVPPDLTLWIDRLVAGRWSPSVLLDKIIGMWESTKAEWVGVECDGGGRMVYSRLRDRCRERQIPMRVVELKSRGMPKPSRIASLQEHIQTYGCRYRPNMRQYLDEIIRYPVAQHDDVPDVLAHRILKLSKPARQKPVPKKPKPDSNVKLTMLGQDILDRINKRQTSGRLLWVR